MFNLMTNEAILRKFIHRTHNKSEDQRVSKRMYYNRATGLTQQNYHFHWKKTVDSLMDDVKTEKDHNETSNKELNPVKGTNKLRQSTGNMVSRSDAKKSLLSPNTEESVGLKSPNTAKRSSDIGLMSKDNLSIVASAKTHRRAGSIKSANKASKYNSFYYKQLSFVENKMSKIEKELHKREESLSEMEKKRNTMSMLSLGSKKILEKIESSKRSQNANLASPSFVNLDIIDDRISIPSTSQNISNTSRIHDRLYKEKHILELKKNIMRQEQNVRSYRNLHWNKSYAQGLKSANKSLKSLSAVIAMATPQNSRTKNLNLHSTTNQTLSERLENLKSVEK